MTPKDLIKNKSYIGETGIHFPVNSLKKIIQNLQPNESIIVASDMIMDDVRGAIAVTEKRVICVAKGVLNTKTKDFDIGKITSIQFNVGVLSRKLEIKGSSDELKLRSLKAKTGQEIVDKIKELQQSNNTVAAQQETTNLDDLEKLAELRDKGIITEEEFNTKKKQILGL